MTSVRPVAPWLTVALDERQAESLGIVAPAVRTGVLLILTQELLELAQHYV